MKPFAEIMRPKSLKDVIGQGHLIGQTKILTQIIQSQKPLNLISFAFKIPGKDPIKIKGGMFLYGYKK